VRPPLGRFRSGGYGYRGATVDQELTAGDPLGLVRDEEANRLGETPVKVRRGCFLANSSTELAARDPDVVGCARTTYQAVEDCFTNAVARAVAEGDLPEDTNPRKLGRLLLTIQQGLQFLLKTEMSPAALREIGQATVSRLLS
jgi:hypothetical protein